MAALVSGASQVSSHCQAEAERKGLQGHLEGVLRVVLRVAFRESWDWSFKSFLQNLSLVELRPDGDLISEDRRHGFYGGKSGEHLRRQLDGDHLYGLL